MPKQILKSIPKDIDIFQINGEECSNSQLKQYISELPAAKIKHLSLCNLGRSPNCCLFFSSDPYSPNYASRVFDALIKNPNIETLHLDDSFMRPLYFENQSIFLPKTKVFINLYDLSNTNVKKLILGNVSSFILTKLNEYLVSPDCKIEYLHLYGSLSQIGLQNLEQTLKWSTSLKEYYGPAENAFQRILDERYNLEDLPSEDNMDVEI